MKPLIHLTAAFAFIALTAGCGTSTQQNPALLNQTGFNGQGVYTNNYSNGCVPLASGQIPFSAQGVTIDNTKLLAGQLPASQLYPANTYGTVTLGGGYAPNYGAGGVTLMKQSALGSIQINAYSTANMQQQYPQQQYPQQNVGASGNITGVIQLSQTVIQNILAQQGYAAMNNNQYNNQYNNTYNTPYNAAYNLNSICVRSVGIYTVHQTVPSYNGMQSTGQILGALVFLYLNNSTAPISIQL